jgi:hypothetical protein
MTSDSLIKELQKINYEYKSSKDSNAKLQLLWNMGDLLLKNDVVSQKQYWEMQSKGFYLNRSILLRSFWLRSSFSKEEIKKVKIPISKLFEVLPYLTENSKKLSNEKKQELKIMVLENKLVVPSKNPKIKQVKTEIDAVTYAKHIKDLIRRVPNEEVKLFHDNFSTQEKENLKLALLELLKLDLPTPKTKDVLNLALNKFQEHKCTVLFDIFVIVKKSADATKIDSRRFIKITMDPQTIMPLLDILFFNKPR